MGNIQKIGNRYILNYDIGPSQFEHKRFANGDVLPAAEQLDWSIHGMEVLPDYRRMGFCYAGLSPHVHHCPCGLVELRRRQGM